ncbi:MAG: KpsF/GutQ family sugar-phosphate isomerase [Bacteroidetes bacterium]|nr:KpsF/GutQ family sugar-phosphate isomerase [Bacteroidota bacterium]
MLYPSFFRCAKILKGVDQFTFILRENRTLHNAENIVAWARETIETEVSAVRQLSDRIDRDFVEVVNLILNSKGRVVITGIGKSAAIAMKLVATLNSTGTPSMFMHAADAVHGDLGMIREDDVVVGVSKSGNTPEIKVLAPLLKTSGNKLIAMVGNRDSYLASMSDFILDYSVDKEACPNNLAPTSSTTAQLVLGDALAVCLLNARGFTSGDFAKYHPGGALGKRLYTRLYDLSSANEKPEVDRLASVREVIVEMTSGRLGAVAVTNHGNVVGIITDGDIRRMLEKYDSTTSLKAEDIMSINPVTMDENELAADGAKLMAEKKIGQIITTRNEKYSGMVHIHDLSREGILL